jgi:hypothetical protein
MNLASVSSFYNYCCHMMQQQYQGATLLHKQEDASLYVSAFCMHGGCDLCAYDTTLHARM